MLSLEVQPEEKESGMLSFFLWLSGIMSGGSGEVDGPDPGGGGHPNPNPTGPAP
jgi:hypothetical protein